MIYKLNNDLLKTPIPKFDFTNPVVNPWEIVTNLVETMRHYKGIGLSANQCGLPYRVFVMDGNPPLACFNPRIVDETSDMSKLEEGCLSFPGFFVKVNRPNIIKVRYEDADGQTHTEKFIGMSSRVFQHETDHLNGIIFYEKATRLDRDKARNKQKTYLRRLKKEQK